MPKTFWEVTDDVSARLPDGWQLILTLDGNCGGYNVELVDRDGESREFPSSWETLEEAIRDAVECAIECDAGC